jgi:putative hydrolase
MRDLARLLSSPGPLNWEIATQMAGWAATGGAPDLNPEPATRIRLEELLRVAELHVSQRTGLDPGEGGLLSVSAVSPRQWAYLTLQAWRPLLEKLATKTAASMSEGPFPTGESAGTVGGDPGGAGVVPDAPSADPLSALFSNLPQVLGPFLFGIQAGSMVGQLAQRAMGQYDMPMPRPNSRELLMVPQTIDAFARDWSLEPDDVRLWICLREVSNHAVLGRPHVRTRLNELIAAYTDAFDPDPAALEQRLADVDPADPGSLQRALGDPEALLGELQNDTQRRIQVPLHSLLAVVSGYVDHVMDAVGSPLIGSYASLTEALRRRRLDESPSTRVLGRLFGVTLGASSYEAGREFISGVLERAGEEALIRLWRSERELPTPAELEAPGLWLARIDLPD